MNDNDAKQLVIQIEKSEPINHPLTYSNFLLLYPDCPVEETPTNEIISHYGFEVFVSSPRPEISIFMKNVSQNDFYTKVNGVWTKLWSLEFYSDEEIICIKWDLIKLQQQVHIARCNNILNNPEVSEEEKTLWEIYKNSVCTIEDRYDDPDKVKFPDTPYSKFLVMR